MTSIDLYRHPVRITTTLIETVPTHARTHARTHTHARTELVKVVDLLLKETMKSYIQVRWATWLNEADNPQKELIKR